MESFIMYNGVRIPAVGSGTNNFGRADSNDFTSALNGNFAAMDSALRVGYRLFDTAISYGNEKGIGECISRSDIPRKELFIMGKIPNREPYNSSPESIRSSVEKSLSDLKLGYFDMFFIHKAVDDRVAKQGEKMNLKTTVMLWKTLNELYREGKFRAVAVSNFDCSQLTALMSATDLVPMANEIRCNPVMRNTETVEFCKAHKILPIAHSPLSFSTAPGVFCVDEAFKQKLSDIGSRYGKGWAQVQLRYNYQRGIVSIPRSSKESNQIANLNIFDFSLTEEEMKALDS